MKKTISLLIMSMFILFYSCKEECPFRKLQNTKHSTLKKNGVANTLSILGDLKADFKKIGVNIGLFDSLTIYSDYIADTIETNENYSKDFLQKRNGLVDPLCYFWARMQDSSLPDEEKRRMRNIADSLVLDFINFIKNFEDNVKDKDKKKKYTNIQPNPVIPEPEIEDKDTVHQEEIVVDSEKEKQPKTIYLSPSEYKYLTKIISIKINGIKTSYSLVQKKGLSCYKLKVREGDTITIVKNESDSLIVNLPTSLEENQVINENLQIF